MVPAMRPVTPLRFWASYGLKRIQVVPAADFDLLEQENERLRNQVRFVLEGRLENGIERAKKDGRCSNVVRKGNEGTRPSEV